MLREFRDSAGITWRVWDVHPANPMPDRRRRHRRSQAALRSRSSDRRGLPDRRRIVGGGFFQGWLAFDSPVGRRRLAGIPDEWPDAPEPALESLLKKADVVEARLEALRSAEKR